MAIELSDTQRLELWRKIDHQLTTEPESHDQGDFESDDDDDCGTSRCVAGWAIHFFSGGGHRSIYAAKREIEKRHYQGEGFVHSATMGRDILGLSQKDSDWLFYDTDNDEAAAYVARKAGRV